MIVLMSHIVGVISIFFKRIGGTGLLLTAVIVESINLIIRAILTEVWAYRLWLIPLALLNLWMVWVLYKAMKMKYLSRINLGEPQEIY